MPLTLTPVRQSPIQRMAARHLEASARQTALAVLHAEVAITRLDRLRRTRAGITLTHCVARALVLALRENPLLNAHYVDGALHQAAEVNLGMAVATPAGDLMVPVVHGAEALDLAGLSARMSDLVARTRGRQLRPEEMRDATVTLSSLNTSPALRAAVPVLPAPQVAILVALKPVDRLVPGADGLPVAERMLPLSLGFDHRAVNGVPAADLVDAIAAVLADPARLGLFEEEHHQ